MTNKEPLTPLQHAHKWVSGDLLKVKFTSISGYHGNEFITWMTGGRYPYRCEKIPQDSILFFLGEIRQHTGPHNSLRFAKVWWNREVFWVPIDKNLRLIHQGKPQVQNP